MESRIARQVAEIERLKRLGRDGSDAVRQLGLLRHAMNELRRQSGHRSVGEEDARRSDLDAALKFLSQKSGFR
jgi:hypothetical protein